MLHVKMYYVIYRYIDILFYTSGGNMDYKAQTETELYSTVIRRTVLR
jgi:hypothetical protein